MGLLEGLIFQKAMLDDGIVLFVGVGDLNEGDMKLIYIDVLYLWCIWDYKLKWLFGGLVVDDKALADRLFIILFLY